MPKFKDLTGQKINNWKVLEHKGFNKHGASLWLVECDCHKHTQRIKIGAMIKNNQDCGCGGLPDLTGKLFGRWLVIMHDNKDMWLCECQCEKKTRKIIDGRKLRNNGSHSCGCLTIEANKKYNTYDLSGEYGIGWTTNKNDKFYFDLEDYYLIKNFTWITGSDGYVVGTKNRIGFRMHRFIINVPDNIQIDHINRNRKDNRKTNLRFATNQLNSFNQSKRYDNKSGIIGVCWWERDNNWLAQIKYNYKRIFLGYHDNFEDAIVARLKAEKDLFGEKFAPQRHLFEQYNI